MDFQFQSLEPFVPSGKDFEGSKQLFQALGFRLAWDAGDYAGFENESCKFILQRYDHEEFAQNLMISVQVSNVQAYRDFILANHIPEKFKIRIGTITQQPYGQEMNLIDIAGVCWHFIQS
ncbi:hypothetical protein VRU48_15995 [Pedobacter sp. KR3-3]|uniref:Bleomycin resistance protein n=1 Tax=Pedobacter albus TaxID=3113905 RepID=A0ABU7IAY5_9SPHI|nr:hypothetical protein [Pedobacter sp. KR3-3]MEE1946628.1 hypothetical protein [Pedobacter sp. KR3-3]